MQSAVPGAVGDASTSHTGPSLREHGDRCAVGRKQQGMTNSCHSVRVTGDLAGVSISHAPNGRQDSSQV